MNDEYIDVCGVVLPNHPLTNIELVEAAKLLKLEKFRGVFCRDEIPSKTHINECGIISLDDSSGSGTHLTASFKHKSDKVYFVSYGLSPPTQQIYNMVIHPSADISRFISSKSSKTQKTLYMITNK